MFYSDFPALLPVICLCISVVRKTISSLHMAISKLKRICTDGEYSLYVLLFNHIIWVRSTLVRSTLVTSFVVTISNSGLQCSPVLHHWSSDPNLVLLRQILPRQSSAKLAPKGPTDREKKKKRTMAMMKWGQKAK